MRAPTRLPAALAAPDPRWGRGAPETIGRTRRSPAPGVEGAAPGASSGVSRSRRRTSADAGRRTTLTPRPPGRAEPPSPQGRRYKDAPPDVPPLPPPVPPLTRGGG